MLFLVVDVPFSEFTVWAKFVGKVTNIASKLQSLTPSALRTGTVLDAAGVTQPGFPRLVFCVQWGLVNSETQLMSPINWKMSERSEGPFKYMSKFLEQVCFNLTMSLLVLQRTLFEHNRSVDTLCILQLAFDAPWNEVDQIKPPPVYYGFSGSAVRQLAMPAS